MNSQNIPSFEIPKTPESVQPGLARGEVDRTLKFDSPHENLPTPVVMPAQSAQLQQIDSQSAQGAGLITSSKTDDQGHLVADEVDVIEKEWVDRAKKVVALTADDPYSESLEISKLRAAYVKKRFQKNLPLADEKGAV